MTKFLEDRRENPWLPGILLLQYTQYKNEEELELSVVDCHHDSTTIIPSGRVASVMDYLEQG